MKVKDDDGQEHIPVRLFDCRGLLDEKRGVQTRDIINICDGHVKDKYEVLDKTPRKKSQLNNIAYMKDFLNAGFNCYAHE